VAFGDSSLLTTIGLGAFGSCTSLAGITIPASVGSIGDHAFDSCTSLARIAVDEANTNYKSLDGVLFDKGVTTLVAYPAGRDGGCAIPAGVTSIGDYAFSGCSGLSSLEIPDGVESIGLYAFQGCSSLATVKIIRGEQALSLGAGAFYGTAGSATLQWAGGDVPDGYRVSFGIAPGDAGYSVDGNTLSWNGRTGRATLSALKRAVTITAASQAWTYDGKEHENKAVDVTKGELADGDELFAEAAGSVTNVWETRDGNNEIADGYKVMRGDKDVTDEYVITPVAGTLTVTPAPLTITAKDQEYVYNGKQQGEGDPAYDNPDVIATKVEADGLQGNDAITSIELNGSHTDAGVYEGLDGIAPSAARIGEGAALTGNYAITYVNGKLAIEPAPLTVATGSASKVYDGTPLTKAEASIEGLVDGETATVEATGSRTEVGSSANTCSIKWGTAKAGNYAVTERLGTLTVEAAPARKATLTFDLAGGTLDGKTCKITIEANVGDTIKLPDAPTKSGYAFKFWKGSEYAAGAEYKVEGDHAFTAEWEKNGPAPVATHTVTFDANGHGKAPDAQEVEHGKKAKRPTSPTADGYTFGGWYTDKDCKDAYDFSAPVTSDITLYAKWTKKSSSGSGTSPKTGDPTGGAFALALALAAVSGLALALSRRRSRG